MTLLEQFQNKMQAVLEIINTLETCNEMIANGAKAETIRAMLAMAVHFNGTYEVARVLHEYTKYRPILKCL